MRLFYAFPLVCFISCTPQNNFIDEYVNIIGQNVPDTFILKNGNEYTKFIVESKGHPEIFIKIIADNKTIVHSCFIRFLFSDPLEARKYYEQLYEYIKKRNWQFIENISKYKRPNGALYIKSGIYFGIYESEYAIPIELSNKIENMYRDTILEN